MSLTRPSAKNTVTRRSSESPFGYWKRKTYSQRLGWNGVHLVQHLLVDVVALRNGKAIGFQKAAARAVAGAAGQRGGRGQQQQRAGDAGKTDGHQRDGLLGCAEGAGGMSRSGPEPAMMPWPAPQGGPAGMRRAPGRLGGGATLARPSVASWARRPSALCKVPAKFGLPGAGRCRHPRMIRASFSLLFPTSCPYRLTRRPGAVPRWWSRPWCCWPWVPASGSGF